MRSRYICPLAITLFALWVRLPVLRQGLWEDEATAVYVAESPTIHEFIRRQAAIDYSPPLFNALLAGYGRIFGFGEVPVKALAIGLGAIACGAIALAAAEGFGWLAGAFAGVLATVHPLLVDMAAEARPYSLAAATTALFLWSLFRLRRVHAEATRRWPDLLVYGLCALFAAESHYSGTAAVAAIGAWSLLAAIPKRGRSAWLPVAAITAAVGAVLLPWAPIAWRQLHVGLPWAIRSSTVTYWDMAIFKTTALLPTGFDPNGRFLPAGAALCTAAALSGWSAFRSRWKGERAVFALTAVAAAAAFFSVGVAGAVTRYVTVPAALVAIIIGGLASIVFRGATDSGRIETIVATAGLALLAFLVLRPAIRKESAMFADARAGRSRSFIRDLCRQGRFRPGDLVIAAPDMIGPTLWYYLPPGTSLRGFVHWEEPAFADFSDYRERWASPRTVPAALESLKGDLRTTAFRRIVLVYAVGNDNPLPFRTRTAELRAGISERYRRLSSTIDGTTERLEIDVWDAKEALGSGSR